MSEWKDVNRETGKALRYGLFWGLLVLVLAGLVSWGIWGITVAVSGPKGQGDAIIQKNSAENWTAAQARFEDLYADIEATDRKITVAAEALAASPDDKTAKQTYSGTVNYCIEVVGDYNAEARKFLAEQFRSVDLPAQIDNRNPSTDCHE